MNKRLLPKTQDLPHALYLAEQLRDFDRQISERFEISEEVMIDRAGTAAFKFAYDHWPEVHSCHVFCGKGKNGEDGFIFALKAKLAGWNVSVSFVSSENNKDSDFGSFAKKWCEKNDINNDPKFFSRDCDLIVDSILGIGLNRPIDGVLKEAVRAINQHPAPVLSMDIPTGLNSDTGKMLDVAVKANATITFIGLKQGMFTADGVDCCGDIFFESIDIPAVIYASQILSCRRLSWKKQSTSLVPRKKSSHKGNFGHLLIIGGDHGFGGAVRLAGEAALRSGVGLVSVATRKDNVTGLLASRPEIMTHCVDDPEDIAVMIEKADAVVIGPGLGLGEWGKNLLKYTLKKKEKIVFDADALKLLPDLSLDYKKKLNSFIFTPHPKEAQILGGGSREEIFSNRFSAAQRLQGKYSGCIVLKGAGTIIASDSKIPLAVCSDGNPGMASGGMGDVLSGVIGAFYAQNYSARDAAEMGVCLHSAAADLAATNGEKGLLAMDLMSHLKELLNKT